MARRARVLIAGLPYHIELRAAVPLAGPACLVLNDEDRIDFMRPVRTAAQRGDIALHAWALLDSRFHALLTPASVAAIPTLMQALGREYAPAFRRRHGRRGPLWRGRFASSPVEPGAAMLRVQLVVEHAPLRPGAVAVTPTAQAVTVPEQMPNLQCASARVHCGMATDPLLTMHEGYWRLGNTPFEREAAYRALYERMPERGTLPALPAAVIDVDAAGSARTGGGIAGDPDTAGGNSRGGNAGGGNAGGGNASGGDAARTVAQIERALALGHAVASAAWLELVLAEHGVDYRVGPVGRPRKAPPSSPTACTTR